MKAIITVTKSEQIEVEFQLPYYARCKDGDYLAILSEECYARVCLLKTYKSITSGATDKCKVREAAEGKQISKSEFMGAYRAAGITLTNRIEFNQNSKELTEQPEEFRC
jgi:hypothetical protein